MKLMNLIPITEGGKLFGTRAERVTTEEMKAVFKELKSKLEWFEKFELTKSLPSKKDHGDIDIVAMFGELKPKMDTMKYIIGNLQGQVSDHLKNSYIYSILFHSKAINKKVHVDFIVSDNKKIHNSRIQYFSYNDFSGVLGIFSKKLNFKYGSEGFFKRYRDKKGNWHDIPISSNLEIGLKILGYSDISQFRKINDIDDIINFISSSKLFDSSFVTHDVMNQSDRKSMKRPVIGYAVKKLRSIGNHRTIKDDDYYLKKIYPSKYKFVQKTIEQIEEKIHVAGPYYDGKWVLDNFKVKQGPDVGKILKLIQTKFGNSPNSKDENKIISFIKQNGY